MGHNGISSCKLVMTELTVAGRRPQAVTVKIVKSYLVQAHQGPLNPS